MRIPRPRSSTQFPLHFPKGRELPFRESAKQEAGPGPLRRSLGHRDFRRLLGGQAVSGFGDWVGTVAFLAAAYDLSGKSSAAAGGILALRLAPTMIGAPAGGLVADRMDRRLIMIISDLVRAGLIAAVPFFGLGMLYVLAFVHEALSIFSLPARDALVPDLVEPDELAAANGLVLGSSYGSIPLAAAFFSGLVAIPAVLPHWLPLSGFLSSHVWRLAFFFDAATFLVSAWAVARITAKGRARGTLPPAKGMWREGLSFLKRTPGLPSLGAGISIAALGGGILFALGIAYVHETLGGDDRTFGYLASLFGAGMAIGLVIAQKVGRLQRANRFPETLALQGITLASMGACPWVVIAFPAAVVFGAATAATLTLGITLLQEGTPEEFRGRAFAAVHGLVRFFLLAGIGLAAIAGLVPTLRVGPIKLDGNQMGLLVAGAGMIAGAVIARKAVGSFLDHIKSRPSPAGETTSA
ncbi:MAG: MFS transporter [Actinomycetota bacterium]